MWPLGEGLFRWRAAWGAVIVKRSVAQVERASFAPPLVITSSCGIGIILNESDSHGKGDNSHDNNEFENTSLNNHALQIGLP